MLLKLLTHNPITPMEKKTLPPNTFIECKSKEDYEILADAMGLKTLPWNGRYRYSFVKNNLLDQCNDGYFEAQGIEPNIISTSAAIALLKGEQGKGEGDVRISLLRIIECPLCKHIQPAKVEPKIPFDSYIHHCVKCGYVIMESEWNEVDVNQQTSKLQQELKECKEDSEFNKVAFDMAVAKNKVLADLLEQAKPFCGIRLRNEISEAVK